MTGRASVNVYQGASPMSRIVRLRPLSKLFGAAIVVLAAWAFTPLVRLLAPAWDLDP